MKGPLSFVAALIVNFELPGVKHNRTPYSPGDLLRLCKGFATANTVPIGAQRIMNAWLKSGCDPDEMEKKNKLNTSCLMYMCKGGHYNMIKLLIQASATVNSQNLLGDTPLSLCAARVHVHSRYYQCAKLLLSNGAAVNTWDRNGVVPLCWAATFGHIGLTKKLLEAGASQNVHPNRNNRPLPMAVKNKHKTVIKLLTAAWNREEEVAEAKEKANELLLERKRQKERRDREAKTPGKSYDDRRRARKLERLEARQRAAADKDDRMRKLASGDFKQMEKEEEEQKKREKEYELGEQVDTTWKVSGLLPVLSL
jgi:hypothetical protein